MCFLPLLSPSSFHKLHTCQPSVFTLQTFCQSVPPCTILAHGPTTQAAGPSFSSLLQVFARACSSMASTCLCVIGQQSQSHCHTPIFLTVLSSPYPAHPESQDPLITDITYLLEHSCEPLPSLSSFFSQDPIFQFNSSCFHRLCLFQCD